MKNNGRAERRRDWFRPMASSVSALSSIVANGLQILPSFPPPPLLTSRNALTGTRANSTRLRIGWTRTLFQLRTLRNLLRMQRPHPRSKGPNERPAVAAGTALCLHIECQRPSTTEADPAAAGRPPMSLRKPAAWQRLWLIPPPLGRMGAIVGQLSGGSQAERTGPNKCQSSLLTHPGQVGKGCLCRASCALSILGQCITS
jgi:hypothetical protein